MSEAQTEMRSPTAVPQPAPAKTPTRYVVLYVADPKGAEEAWVKGGVFDARSPQKAIDLYLDSTKAEEGTFIAVPARSWEPITVKTETRTRRIFE
jgi:hypothetical protein